MTAKDIAAQERSVSYTKSDLRVSQLDVQRKVAILRAVTSNRWYAAARPLLSAHRLVKTRRLGSSHAVLRRTRRLRSSRGAWLGSPRFRAMHDQVSRGARSILIVTVRAREAATTTMRISARPVMEKLFMALGAAPLASQL